MNPFDLSRTTVFEDFGVRFVYPASWELDVSEDGSRHTVSLQVPGGSAFALVTLDTDRPAPSDLIDEALEAMREEYPGLDDSPVSEVLDHHEAIGHDLSFLSLDMVASCAIRSYRTPQRTIFFLGQWSDLDGDEIEAQFHALRNSLEQVDS